MLQTQETKFYTGLEVKDVNEAKGIVTFKFGSHGDIDRDGDIIRKGAYTKTLKEREQSVKHFRNHDTSESAGKILNIFNEDDGIYAESKLIMENPAGSKTFYEYKYEVIDQHSQGFFTIKSKPIEGKGKDISELMLLEVSSLSFLAANKNTPMVGLKSMKTLSEMTNYVNKMNDLLSGANIHDVTGRELEKLVTAIKSLMSTIEEPQQHSQDSEPIFDISKLQQEFKQLM